jgi:hypothetical protein
MQSFKGYYQGKQNINEGPHDDFVAPSGQLPRREASSKVKQLLDLVNGIQQAVDAAQETLANQEFSPDEVNILQQRIASLAKDLEGTHLPPEAEGKAAAGYSALSGMNFPESVQPMVNEALQLLEDIWGFRQVDEGLGDMVAGAKKKWADFKYNRPAAKYGRMRDAEKAKEAAWSKKQADHAATRDADAKHKAEQEQIPGTPEYKRKEYWAEIERKRARDPVYSAGKDRKHWMDPDSGGHGYD